MSIERLICRIAAPRKASMRVAAKSLALVASLFPAFDAGAALASEPSTFSTAFFEKLHVPPLNTAQLRALVAGKTVTFKLIATGAQERVFYGPRRVDKKGARTAYRISKSAIEQTRDGVPHLLLIYEWQGRTFGCLENVGDLDELGDQEGLCPYEIVEASSGNQAKGE
jgi:hypothetical protein